MKEKKKLAVILLAIVVVGIIAADLILFWTSAKQDGIGRGFSRYWSQEE
jgi:flagellar basal body-associated protein FliL